MHGNRLHRRPLQRGSTIVQCLLPAQAGATTAAHAIMLVQVFRSATVFTSGMTPTPQAPARAALGLAIVTGVGVGAAVVVAIRVGPEGSKGG